MNKFRDLLTYRPGSSDKRQLRQFVRVGLAIFGMLVAAMIFALVEKALTNAAMEATKAVVVEQMPTLSATWPASSTSPADTCPADPSQWNLVVVGDGKQYDRIDPPCVYDGLGRTVAWVMAAQMGYTRAEANDLLGFSFDSNQDESAMDLLPDITILTYPEGKIARVGLYTKPPTLEYAEWVVTGNEKPAITYSMLGCFRTLTVKGTSATDWGDGYPVICALAQDTQTGFFIRSLGGHLYTESIPKASRAISLFGYTSGGRWAWLGNEKGVEIDQSGTSQKNLQEGYRVYSTLYLSPVWTGQWAADTFGIELKNLPDGWRTANNPGELQAIVSLINQSLSSQ